MKILSIQYGNIKNPYSHGGLANLLHETFKRMAPKHNITCYTGLLSRKAKLIKIDGIKYIQKGISKNKFMNRSTFSIGNSLPKSFGNFDLILTPWDRYAPLLINSVTDCPIVLEMNLDFFSIPSRLKPVEPISRFLLKKRLNECKYLISSCNGVLEKASRFLKNVQICEIIPSGASDELFTYDEKNIGNEDYLLYLGRLDISHKGIDVLLESYKQANIDLPLIIAGDGIDKIKVEKLIKKIGLDKKVKMVGWVKGEKKYELLSNCLAVCIPSRVEGWGIVATEAAAMGKPVVGTKVTGLEESILDGITGILVPKDDISEFTCALKQIIQNKPLRKQLGDQARERAYEFTWDKIAKKREDFFYKVIEDFKRSKKPTNLID